MALRRVFVDLIADGEAVAYGSVARHLARVARLRCGERVEVSDQARVFRATAISVSAREVRFRLEEQLPAVEPASRLEAAVAIIRYRRFEWAIEKLTELGVQRIVPIIAERSDSKLVGAAPKRVERWRRIAFEAAQQSRRLCSPSIEMPTLLEDVVRAGASAGKLILEPGGAPVCSGCDSGYRFLVGPEGGWSAEERRLAAARGFRAVGLGHTVLRTETAAVAMAAICASRFHGRGER